MTVKSYPFYYRQIAKLGFPILIGQLGMVVVGFADNIMVGQYSTAALAASSFVNNLFNCTFFCCMGFTYGLLPLAGALFGSSSSRKDSFKQIGSLMRNAVSINVLFALLLTAIMVVAYCCIPRMGQPEELLPLIRPYFLLYLAGILPIALFNVFAQWAYALKNTSMPMWIILGSNAINIAGNYALIYGHWGLPELGLVGAGISTLFARVLCPLAIMLVFFCARKYADCKIGFLEGKVRRETFKLVWITSIPIALQMAFESGAFSGAAIMAGWIGTVALASYQIIIIIGTLGFTLYYAIGSAIAVLVSNEAGTNNMAGMRRAGWAGYHCMLLLACFSSLMFALFAHPLMHLFTSDSAVLATSISLLVPLMLYQLGDATQITFANALRGTSHVMPMLWIALVSYIIIGLPATYLIAFPLQLGIYGIVLSFSVSLFLAGALFLYFFIRATKNKYTN